MVAICLGPALPPASSDQPEDRPGTYRPPTWSCSGRGLPSRPVTRPLVRSYRTISPLPGAGRVSGRFLRRKADTPAPGGMFLWHFP